MRCRLAVIGKDAAGDVITEYPVYRLEVVLRLKLGQILLFSSSENLDAYG